MQAALSVGRRALRLVAAAGVVLVTLTAVAGAIVAGPTLWAQWTGRAQAVTVRWDSLERHVRVYRPARHQPRPSLVLNLQGTGGNGAFEEAVTGFDRQADRLGWIVAYPDALPGSWTAFGCCGTNDDVGFLGAVIDRLKATDGIDPHRVYVTGISRGGMMAYRLGCQLSSRVAAIAPVAGNMADASGSAAAVGCAPSYPVSVLAVHGSADPEVPIEGGRSRMSVESIAYAPLDQVLGRWRGIDGCAQTAERHASSASVLTRWGCGRGTVVASLVVNGAGHTWPGAVIFNPPGSAAAGVDASTAIADFFGSLPPRAGPS